MFVEPCKGGRYINPTMMTVNIEKASKVESDSSVMKHFEKEGYCGQSDGKEEVPEHSFIAPWSWW